MYRYIEDYLVKNGHDIEYDKLRVALPCYSTDEHGKPFVKKRYAYVEKSIMAVTIRDGAKELPITIKIKPIFHDEFPYIEKGLLGYKIVIIGIFYKGHIPNFTKEDANYIGNKLNSKYSSLFRIMGLTETKAIIRVHYLCQSHDSNGTYIIQPFYKIITQSLLDTFFKEFHSAQKELAEYINDTVSPRNDTVSPRKDEGCYITTATCLCLQKTDNCYELNKFREFRDSWLLKQPGGEDLVNTYYSISPQIVNNINKLKNSKQVYKNIWDNFLQPCLTMIENEKFNECKDKYIKMVKNLQNFL